MGRRRLQISDCLFSSFLGKGDRHYRVSNDPLPDDTKVINVRMLFPSIVGPGVVEYLLESSDWEGPNDGELIPALDMRITSLQTWHDREPLL